jgi:arsenate reductase (thioredoxin)
MTSGASAKRILIICTGNSARSQMAEGLLRHAAGDRFEIQGAGTEPTHVRPEAIEVMRELGIDISNHRSKSIDEFAEQEFDYVITVCDNARQNCPVFPGSARYIHWSIEDPAAQGSDDELATIFRRTRDDLATRIQSFVPEH